MGGTNQVNHLYLGNDTGSNGTYNIPILANAVLNAGEFYVGVNGHGYLNIGDPECHITISNKLSFGSDSQFSVAPSTPGCQIKMTGASLDNKSTDASALGGFGHVKLVFCGNPATPSQFEVAGKAYGGFTTNFALQILTLGDSDNGSVKLVDANDNGRRGSTGKECLYTGALNINSGSQLDVNGKLLYVQGDVQSTLNGWITDGRLKDNTVLPNSLTALYLSADNSTIVYSQPIPVAWSASAGKSWHTPGNWDSNPHLPASCDAVIINPSGGSSIVTYSQNTTTVNSLVSNAAFVVSGGTLLLSNASQINNTLTLSNGTLGGNGNLSLNQLVWSGGTLAGTGTTSMQLGGTVQINGSAAKYLDSRILTLSAGATWSGTGGIIASNGAIINNPSGTLFDIQNNLSFSCGSGTSPTINNAGTLYKSAGAGVATIAATLNNTGTVRALSGTLTLSGGIAQLSGNSLNGGAWEVGPNSSLNITAGGNILVNHGSITLNGSGSTFNKCDLLADNEGLFNIIGGRNFTTVGNLANSGTVTVGSGSDFEVSGALSGTGNLNVNGILTANSIVQNTLTIGAGGIVTIRPISGGPLAAQDQISPVPEPATITLLYLVGVGLGLWHLKKRD